MLYWLHVREGTDLTAFGPFDSEAEHLAFRQTYADDEDEQGARRSYEELPRLPYLDVRDNYETDSWFAIKASTLELFDGWPVVNPNDYED
jgi:hypothetical protein